MKSIAKLFGISSCCVTIAAAAANAEPIPLADAELDRVTAGACRGGPGDQFCNDTPDFIGPLVFPSRPSLDTPPGTPVVSDPPPVEVPRAYPFARGRPLGSWTFQFGIPHGCTGAARTCVSTL